MSDPLTETVLIEAIKPIDDKLESTKLLLQGPPGKPQEGIIVRMDRIERTIVWLVKGFGLVVAAFVAAGANAFFQWFVNS